MDLAPTIAGRAGWPCVEEAWSDCAVRFAPGGLTPAEWYEETRFEASEYPVAVDADGAPVGEPGVEVAVGTARALYDALENRDVSRIRVLNSFSLPDLRDWRWPDEGYPVRRDLALFADAACATCAICGGTLAVTWDPARQALVCEGAAMLRHRIFHAECLATRRGP